MSVRVLCVGNKYPPHHLGGYELVWEGTAKHLRATGHDIRILTTDHRQPGVVEADEPGVHRDLHAYWHDHGWPRLGLRDRLALERHNAAVFDRHVTNAWRPDVVAWWAMGGMSLSLLARARRHGVPAAAFVHDDWLLYGPAEDQWTRLFALRPWAAQPVRLMTSIDPVVDVAAVSHWAFVSAFTRDRALAAGHALSNVEVAHSGIEESFIGPGRERVWDWRLLFIGRIDERKGADTALQALAHLPAQATLTVVGDGDNRHRLELLAAAASFRDRVDVRPGISRSKLPAVIDEHDVVVFPSRWDEPWGLVPLEAMARGRPVVSTRRGGSREYLRDGENCLAFEPDDPVALARQVTRLAQSEPLRDRLRDGGLESARRHTETGFNARAAQILHEASDLGGTI